MKNLFLLTCTILLCGNISAQTWWSDDANWVFGSQGTGWPTQYLVHVYVDGTDVIDGEICKVLKSKTRIIDNFTNDTTYLDGIYGYAFESGNKAMCYFNDQFITLYDFDMNIGDIMTLPLEDGTSVQLQLESVDAQIIDGQTRSVQSLKIFSECGGNDGVTIQAYKGMGVTATLLEGYQGPFFYKMFDCFVPDPTSTLICHADTDFNYPEGADCLELNGIVNSNTDITNDLSFEIFPNPTVNIIEINNQVGYPIVDLEIYDEGGKLISNNIPVYGPINVRELTSGIYFLKVYFQNKQIGMKRFLKF